MQLVLGKLNQTHLTNLLKQSIPFATSVRAAVAYSQPHEFFDHFKTNKIPLKFYGLLDDDGGATSPVVLKTLLDWGSLRVECRLIHGAYHPKVIWWHGFGAYIGSANLTAAAWSKNVECGTFFTEQELEDAGFDEQLDQLFDYLDQHSAVLSTELYKSILDLGVERDALRRQQERVRAKHQALLGSYPSHVGLTVVRSPGKKPDAGEARFVEEWRETLQLLRDLAIEFEKLQLRPGWLPAGARRSVHFDQFLHAYYYSHLGQSDDERIRSSEAVERAHEKNKSNPASALKAAAQWWASLRGAPGNEDKFVGEVAPRLERSLSPAAIRTLTDRDFSQIMTEIHAFREHARQIRNADLDLPAGHSTTKDERARIFARWLWQQRTPTGAAIADVLEFVLHGSGTVEHRIWTAIRDPAWRLPHLGRSIWGETIGWARPDDYPARNDRTNKALRALGFDVRLFGS